MASFPGAKVHRVNRRKLGRGQTTPQPFAVATVTSTGTTNATLTFDRPVVVSDLIPLSVATLTLVSQHVVSPTVVSQTFSGTVASHAYSLPPNSFAARTYQGGGTAAIAGTFP